MPRVEVLFAFLAHDDQGEGITVYPVGEMAFPLIGADLERVESLRSMAQEIANVRRTPITLAYFEHRRDIETIKPEP